MHIRTNGYHKLDHAVECHTHARTHILTAEQSGWSAKIWRLHNSYVES